MALSDITREAVLAAVAECDRMGRDAFLDKYGFRRALRYVLRYDGRLYDSKAIAGAAHGHLPGHAPLTVGDLSGGIGHAVTALERLGFEVISEPAAPRTDDEIVRTIGRLRRAPDSGKPMLKQAVVLLWAIGRARTGEDRLMRWTETVAALAPLLEEFRRDGERRQGRPDYPIAALCHAGLWDLPGHTNVPRAHGDAALKAWFAEHSPEGGPSASLYALARESGVARIRFIEAIAARFFDDFDESGLLAAVGLYDEDVATDEPSPRAASDRKTAPRHVTTDPKGDYARLCESVARSEARTRGRRHSSNTEDPIRLAAARCAVLIRSEGRCESPECGSPAPDVNDRGEPVLEVDHVDQISDGGRDHPIQMIALCPDCHAVKTRGRSRHRLIPLLAQTARDLHDRWSAAEA
ncbi:HNH endonuclease signature motif containing protein [Actinoallomurus sp. NPDC050550]|uniref:HNH endonuclease signature motif containing protein n=1 Tax=Actinoallomurus sp. NPDC050550 TaxID=3154937 RepID=UPI0033C7E421